MHHVSFKICATDFSNRWKEETRGVLIDNNRLRQLQSFISESGSKSKIVPYKAEFRFGFTIVSSLGIIPVIFFTQVCKISISFDIVEDDIPFLSGIGMLDAHSLQLLNIQNEIECVAGYQKAAVIHKRGHSFYFWNTTSTTSSVWYTLYIRMLSSMLVDQVPFFISDEQKNACYVNEI